MKPTRWLPRAVGIGGLVAVSGCGVIPVPRLLQPLLGRPPSYTETRLCIVDLSATRGLRVVEAQKEDRSGALFVQREGKRRRLPTTSEGGYAVGEPWYRGEEPIRQYGRRYVKYGDHRVVPASALTRGADHRGIPVFIDREDTKRPAALYIPVEPGCVFQPYIDAEHLSGSSDGREADEAAHR